MRELVDELLLDWYLYSKAWRPHLGMPKCDPACRQSVSSRQWDTTADLVDDACVRITIQRVDECVNELAAKFQNAIGCEMRNRETGFNVWRPNMGATYEEAVEAIVPFMRKRNLLR